MNTLNQKILIVDDIEDNRFTLERRLSRNGYTAISQADCGKKALEFLTTKFGKRLFGITTDKEIIPRAKVYLSSNKQKIGYLSASTWSPTLEKYVGYVRFDYPGEWKEFQIKVESVSDNLADCEIIDLPFYDKEKLIPKGIDKNIP